MSGPSAEGIVGFLRARLDEDEAKRGQLHRLLCLATDYDSPDRECNCGYPARVLREVEAKRRIVEEWESARDRLPARWPEGPDDDISRHPPAVVQYVLMQKLLRLLALPHAGHPHYQREWAP